VYEDDDRKGFCMILGKIVGNTPMLDSLNKRTTLSNHSAALASSAQFSHLGLENEQLRQTLDGVQVFLSLPSSRVLSA